MEYQADLPVHNMLADLMQKEAEILCTGASSAEGDDNSAVALNVIEGLYAMEKDQEAESAASVEQQEATAITPDDQAASESADQEFQVDSIFLAAAHRKEITYKASSDMTKAHRDGSLVTALNENADTTCLKPEEEHMAAEAKQVGPKADSDAVSQSSQEGPKTPKAVFRQQSLPECSVAAAIDWGLLTNEQAQTMVKSPKSSVSLGDAEDASPVELGPGLKQIPEDRMASASASAASGTAQAEESVTPVEDQAPSGSAQGEVAPTLPDYKPADGSAEAELGLKQLPEDRMTSDDPSAAAGSAQDEASFTPMEDQAPSNSAQDEIAAGSTQVDGTSFVLASTPQFEHPHVPAPKFTEIDCKTWDVSLAKRADAPKFGFSYVSEKVMFLKRLGSTAFPMPAAPERLLLKRIVKGALLDEWNLANPNLQVDITDRVSRVNERETIDGMESALLSDEIQLRVLRYPESFHVDLVRRDALSKWGFMFGKSQGGLRIADVAPDGLLQEYNAVRRSQGLFHLVVLPGMWIEAVNGVEDDSAKIKEEIRQSDSLHLRFRRADLDGLTADTAGPYSSSAVVSPSAETTGATSSDHAGHQLLDACPTCHSAFIQDAAFCQICGTARPQAPGM
jgi:hypothetical protein